jgi:hypothetical protein
MEKLSENAAVGAGLLAGGLALRYLAPTMPERQRAAANAAGVVAIAGGGFILFNRFKKSAPTGGMIKSAIGAAIGEPTDEQLEERTETIQATPTPSAPFVGVSGPPLPGATPAETLRINNVRPGHGGTVIDNGFMASDYDVELSLQNNNDDAFDGEIIFKLSEDYLLGDTTGTITRRARVRARSTELVRFTLPILGTRVVSKPNVTCEIGVLTAKGFQLKVKTSWIVAAS